MPDRVLTAMTVAPGVLGLVAVGVCLLLRVDAHRAAATGPRWRRRLLGAALMLLTAAGRTAGRTAGQELAEPPIMTCYVISWESLSTRPAAVNLAQKPEWTQIRRAWAAAREVASDVKGPYPFDEAGKKAMAAGLEVARLNVAALRAEGALTAAEAGLLAADLATLAAAVAEYRPTEMKEWTCYQVRGPVWVAQQRVKDLEGRLALLETLAGQETLQPEVVSRVAATVERQTALLNDDVLKAMTPADRDKSVKTREASLAKLQAIRKRLPGGLAPEADSRWKTIAEALAFTGPLAQSGKSTQAQRKEVDGKLAALKTAGESLAAAGLLAPAEAALLAGEADRLKEQVYRDPPTDAQAKCYETMYVPPARASLNRLSPRVALLESLAASGAVHEAVLAKVVPAIEADLAALADPKNVGELNDAERASAATVRREAAAALEKLKKQMSPAK